MNGTLIDLFQLFYDYVYLELVLALQMFDVFNVPFVFGTELITLAHLIATFIVIVLIWFVAWFPIKILIGITKRLLSW